VLFWRSLGYVVADAECSFFFQAEDGIRDRNVTGVQTCALPICSIAGISHDQRLQLLLIGFCFNAFLEGAAGFGVPIAICAVLLVSLGFKPLQAAMLCLIANGASGAFGAIGLPVLVIDSLGLE